MTHQKPPGISDEEWARTPLAVRKMLAHSLAQLQSPAPDAASMSDTLVRDTHRATVAMPLTDAQPDAPDDNDGATGYMPLDDTDDDNDGATGYIPLDDTDDDNDGATGYMPLDDTDDDGNDGATGYMPLDDIDDDGNDGATGYMPLDDTDDDNDGATVAMPLPGIAPQSSPAEEEGATAYMPVESDEGSTAPVPPYPTPATHKTQITPASHKVTQISPKIVDDLWEQNIVLQGRYRLRRILGKGGFGAAYLAEDIKLKRGCVVKQMLSPKNISPTELEQNRVNFEREAALLVQLNHPGHPNIPEIFDYFSDDSGSYLVMKYIEGQSLKDLLKHDDSAIAWKEAVRYTIDIASALSYMHTHGEEPVLHRDIKPDNVLLGDDGRIWLVDFGLAKTKPVKNTAEIADARAAGSIGYTPFEQWLGESTPASDVYATGVTLHQLVTGVNPIDAYREDDGKIKINIEKLRDLHGQLDSIRRINRKLPHELEEIIEQVTLSSPEQRPTALQFQQQLEVLISGAKDAALFTFKNGQSAFTISELVDLCEQNRVEAQGYLYRGDFQRWFSLINRNDLSEAAARAVKHGEKGKDGLEKFLKLIMPNIFLRRLWKAGLKVARVGVQLLLILVIAALIVVVVGTLSARWLLHRTIANYDWDYYALSLDDPNVFSQAYLTGNAKDVVGLYLEDVQIDPQASGQVAINGNLANLASLNLPIKLAMSEGQPHITLTQVNGIPLYWIADYLNEGINQGIADALATAPIEITALRVDDEQVVLEVQKSERVAYTPPTPIPNATPTATPLPTPTPPGEALLAVFNDLEQDITIEIEGDRWLIRAQDTKVIEKSPGTYNYRVMYVANGQLAAQGTKTWTYRAYKWRIGLDGETFE